MVDRIAAAGHELTVFARRPEARRELAEAGLDAVDTAGEAAGAAEVLVVCTFNDEQVREVLYDSGALARMAPGSVLVNHVTGSPTLIRSLAADAPAGVGVLDVPVSGGPHDIAAGRLTLLVGGSGADLESARPVLATYRRPDHRGG